MTVSPRLGRPAAVCAGADQLHRPRHAVLCGRPDRAGVSASRRSRWATFLRPSSGPTRSACCRWACWSTGSAPSGWQASASASGRLATAATGLAWSFPLAVATRLVMGAGEASSNPAGARVIREWIPAGERGMVNAIFNSGSYAGPAICALVAGPIIACVRLARAVLRGRRHRPALAGCAG